MWTYYGFSSKSTGRFHMNQYKLIAFDMDGTLLNSQKSISPLTIRRIEEAYERNIHVVFNTGRCPAELNEFFDIVPSVRYVNCVSGALVYDHKEDHTIYSHAMDIPTVRSILEIAGKEDVMMHLLSTQSIVQEDKIPQMDKYHMGVYQEMYLRVTTPWKDLPKEYSAHPVPIEKINLYHTAPDARIRTRERITASPLDVVMADAEASSLEITANSIDKGVGLLKLCEHLHITPAETIVVGDADNDYAALKVAGLPVAMGNANDRIKGISEVTVADNDHDGCAEVIEKFLL